MKRVKLIAALCLLAQTSLFNLSAATVVSSVGQVIPAPDPNARYTKVAAGGAHTLALRTDGTVAAWGRNAYYGQCEPPTGLTDVVEISAGSHHSVALKSDGRVVAWGADSSAQCSATRDWEDVRSIATGNFFTLGLKSDGTILSTRMVWTENGGAPETFPPQWAGITAIAAGIEPVGLKSDGTVLAQYWLRPPKGLTGVIAIAVGIPEYGSDAGTRYSGHCLALKSDGSIVAWGANDFGECNVPENLRDVVAIKAGAGFSLAIKSDGSVVAWGRNREGQTTIPNQLGGIIDIAGGGAFRYLWKTTELTGANGHCIAVKADGTLAAWGSNVAGETSVHGIDDAIDVKAAGNHSLVLKSDGSVAEWGLIWTGTWQTARPPAGLNDVVAIAAARFHSLALKSDGTIVAWGSNLAGETTVPEGLSNVVAIAAWGGGRDDYYGDTAAGASMALKADGTVVAWGSNSGGQTDVPAGLSGVVAIFAPALALKADGEAVSWGRNRPAPPASRGQIVSLAFAWGGGVALQRDGALIGWPPSDSPTPRDVIAIAFAGNGYTGDGFWDSRFFATRSDGTVVSWSGNNYPQVDAGVANLNGLNGFAASGSHILAMQSAPDDHPQLRLQRVGASHILSWPLGARGFALQSSNDLSDPNAWLPATDRPIIVDSRWQFIDNHPRLAKFYRLKK